MPINRLLFNPFGGAEGGSFVPAAAQEEALSRLEYRAAHGAGWCVISGPGGIGKTALLNELSRRAARRGERCTQLTVDPDSAGDLLRLTAEAWDVAATNRDRHELRRGVEDWIRGGAVMQQTAWLLIDLPDEASREVLAFCRWLSGLAAQARFGLMLVVAAREGS